ncbi:hypothetical protein K239x_06420 [Planctomycetes bacterium K23_9]|uniref:Uncharacterized protein n=1 Tax=Stieleria marina TaxID=1930275 RepID=A0A517NNJ4_9BACT|nr:hypothetical protein K239x_06420 [Planctomycetes bacterium K23_9]
MKIVGVFEVHTILTQHNLETKLSHKHKIVDVPTLGRTAEATAPATFEVKQMVNWFVEVFSEMPCCSRLG